MADDELPRILATFLAGDHSQAALLGAMRAWLGGNGTALSDPEALLASDLPATGHPSRMMSDTIRSAYIAEFGFAVPTPELVARLAALGPIAEIGAGRATLARLVANAGGDILASDLHPEPVPHFPVLPGEAAEVVRAHPDRAILCSWPSLGGRWIARAAAAMAPGQVLVLIGEGPGGCTGPDDFWALAEEQFEISDCLGDADDADDADVWRFPGIHDQVMAFRRT